MSTAADESRSRWDADVRSRAHTRALLMSLARDRDWYFVLPPASNALLGLLTLGLWPLFRLRRRVDRWRRLEWNQRGEIGRWIAAHGDAAVGHRLAADADAAARPRERDVAFAMMVSAVVIAWSVVTWIAVDRGVPPGEWLWPKGGAMGVWLTAAHGACAFAWGLIARRASRSMIDSDPWFGALNAWLASRDRRPIEPSRGRRRWRVAGGVLAFAGVASIVWAVPAWIVTVPFVLAAWNGDVIATRAERLQLIARLLEWMDDGGVPVEYDVEALEPEEIAAMIA